MAMFYGIPNLLKCDIDKKLNQKHTNAKTSSRFLKYKRIFTNMDCKHTSSASAIPFSCVRFEMPSNKMPRQLSCHYW